MSSCFNQEKSRTFVGDVTLSNQAEVDAFGQGAYTKIYGNLVITGTVESVEPLVALRHVTGNFAIVLTNLLKDLKGLQCLKTVGGFLGISSNTALTDISQLVSLEKVTDSLTVAGNLILVTFGTFARIEQLGGLQVFQNPLLESIDAFHSCKLQETGNVTFSENTVLSSTNIFKHAKSVADIVVIQESSLVSASIAPCATNITSIAFDQVPLLENISTYCNLAELGSLCLKELSVLSEVPLFPKLTSVGGAVQIQNMPALESIDGLSAVESVASLIISDCAILANIDGLVSLATVENSITISDCVQLLTTAPLSNLLSVGDNATVGTLTVQNNTLLDDFCGLQPLAEAQQSGFYPQFSVTGNASNPTKPDIAVLPACNVCTALESVLQRWLAAEQIESYTVKYFLHSISESRVKLAAKSGALSPLQASALIAWLGFYARVNSLAVSAVKLACSSDAVDEAYLRYQVAMTCKKFCGSASAN